MRSYRAGGKVLVVGFVEVAERDRDDNITAVNIRNIDGDCWLVGNDRLGTELLELSGELVEVVGVLGREKNGVRSLAVERYQILGVDYD